LEEGGAKGRHKIVEAITTSFVSQTMRGLEHSREVMAALTGRFKLGVVSNFYGNLDRVLADARLERYFAAVVDSSRLGIFKPELGIYQDALKKMRSAPAETGMIGDSLSKDCAPAKMLGMRTVWLRADSSRAVAESADAIADVTIESIDEVARMTW
jgi:putative hydrolase of the HAD superfamily